MAQVDVPSAGGGSTTLQDSYDASTSPQIVLTVADGALVIQDAAVPLGTDLLAIETSAGATLFAVGAGAIDVGVDVLPTGDLAQDLGSSALRFGTGWAGKLIVTDGLDTFNNTAAFGLFAVTAAAASTSTATHGGYGTPALTAGEIKGTNTGQIINAFGGSTVLGNVTGSAGTSRLITNNYAYGAFVGGYAICAGTLAELRAEQGGCFVFGYAYAGTVTSTATLRSDGKGSFVGGFSKAVASGISEIRSDASGAFVQGLAFAPLGGYDGRIVAKSTADGSFVQGATSSTGVGGNAADGYQHIYSGSAGKFVQGFVHGINGFTATLGGIGTGGLGAFVQGAIKARTGNATIDATSAGSFAQGRSRAQGTSGTATILSSSLGSFAQGYCEADGVGNVAITSSALGSFAQGWANTAQGDIVASANNAAQFGPGTNATADSLQVGANVLLEANGDVTIGGDLNHDGSNVGFFGTAPAVKPTVTGSRGGNAALASLLTGGASLGFWTDSTTA